jgi:hypothetical protein
MNDHDPVIAPMPTRIVMARPCMPRELESMQSAWDTAPLPSRPWAITTGLFRGYGGRRRADNADSFARRCGTSSRPRQGSSSRSMKSQPAAGGCALSTRLAAGAPSDPRGLSAHSSRQQGSRAIGNVCRRLSSRRRLNCATEHLHGAVVRLRLSGVSGQSVCGAGHRIRTA